MSRHTDREIDEANMMICSAMHSDGFVDPEIIADEIADIRQVSEAITKTEVYRAAARIAAGIEAGLAKIDGDRVANRAVRIAREIRELIEDGTP